MKKNFSVSVGIGAPSLMTIFLILSLVSFSVLSYMTARADFRFTQNFERRSNAYYNASNLAEKTIATLTVKLNTLIHPTVTGSVFGTEAQEFLNLMLYENEKEVIEPGNKRFLRYSLSDNTISFAIVMLETQDLQVTLEVRYPHTATEPEFVVTQWQVVQTGVWEPDLSMSLIMP